MLKQLFAGMFKEDVSGQKLVTGEYLYINPIGLHKRMYWFVWDWLLRRPATMRFLADQVETSPGLSSSRKGCSAHTGE